MPISLTSAAIMPLIKGPTLASDRRRRPEPDGPPDSETPDPEPKKLNRGGRVSSTWLEWLSRNYGRNSKAAKR